MLLRIVCSLVLTAMTGIVSVAWAEILIELPINRITQLDYAGIEYWNDNGNFIVDSGDSFQGLLLIESIADTKGKVDVSDQLMEKELVIHFKFSVVAGPDENNHLEFDMEPTDFFRFYVRDDPVTPLILDPAIFPEEDMVDLVTTTGDLWLEILPNVFFESVNDPDPNPIPGTTLTLNRIWSDVSTNNTGYLLLSLPIRTKLKENGNHIWEGNNHMDHSSLFTIDNHVTLPPGVRFI